MEKIIAIFRLSRPLNALLVLLALWITRIVMTPFLKSGGLNFTIDIFDYWIVCFIGTLILAAGNVINDIIDREIDVINKPQRALIPKVVSVRFAYSLYFSLNFLAIILSIFLARKYGLVGYLIVPLIAILVLYIYSKYLKKTTLIGNLTIAILCAAMPFVAWLLESQVLHKLMNQNRFAYQLLNLKVWSMVVFCFLLVLCREIIKDCEDEKGDLSHGAKTLPVVIGTWNAFRVAIFILFIYLLVFIIFGLFRYYYLPRLPLLILITTYVFFVLFSFLIIFYRFRTEKLFSYLSALIKSYLIFGLIFILF